MGSHWKVSPTQTKSRGFCQTESTTRSNGKCAPFLVSVHVSLLFPKLLKLSELEFTYLHEKYVLVQKPLLSTLFRIYNWMEVNQSLGSEYEFIFLQKTAMQFFCFADCNHMCVTVTPPRRDVAAVGHGIIINSRHCEGHFQHYLGLFDSPAVLQILPSNLSG